MLSTPVAETLPAQAGSADASYSPGEHEVGSLVLSLLLWDFQGSYERWANGADADLRSQATVLSDARNVAASIHAQKNRAGNAYRVLCCQDGRQRSLTFENLAVAEAFQDAAGGSRPG